MKTNMKIMVTATVVRVALLMLAVTYVESTQAGILGKSWEVYNWTVPDGATDFHAEFDWPNTWGLIYPPSGESISYCGMGVWNLNPLPPGKSLSLRCQSALLWGKNLEKAYFTPDKQPLPLVDVDTTATTTYTPDGSGNYVASYTIKNDDTQSVTISDVDAWINNSAVNWGDDLALLIQSTGIVVAGLPSSLSIAPGDSVTFNLGTVSGLGYEKLEVRLAYTATPDEYVGRGMATMVPEPQVFWLVILGIASFLVLGRKGVVH
ncbi:MAG: hypothetical protein ABSE63_17050 [Thermoguttaceae bacterium]|jgi:hypothetical protein